MTDPNLTIYTDLVQGSQDWLDARAGLVTASTIGKLLTPTLKVADNETSRGLIATLAAERITGDVEFVFPNADMRRGTESEPYARAAYVEHYAPVTEVGFMKRHYRGNSIRYSIGYSPDGLVGDDGLIEIKSPRAKSHIGTILRGTVPSYYMAQIQTGLMISGRQWCDFISFHGGLPLFVKRVQPDKRWFDALQEASRNAETEIRTLETGFAVAITGLHPTEKIPELDEILI